jgi:hypothetical protein
MEHLPSLLTILGSRLVIVPAAHPVRRASASPSLTVNIPLVEAAARVHILHNFCKRTNGFQTTAFKQRLSNNGFQTTVFKNGRINRTEIIFHKANTFKSI